MLPALVYKLEISRRALAPVMGRSVKTGARPRFLNRFERDSTKRDVDHGQVTFCGFFVTCCDSSKALEPPDESLNYVASAVEALVETRILILVLPVWNYVANLAAVQPVEDVIRHVSLISGYASGAIDSSMKS